MTTLYGWGPMFGCHSPSPFVLKTDIQLQMFDIGFDYAIADLGSVPKGRAPYVENDGRIIEDSTFIRRHFEQKLGVDLDEGLDARARATAWAVERMLENELTPIMVHERWLEGDNFHRGPAMFFLDVPEAARAQVMADMVEGVRAGLVAIDRHSRVERMRLAQSCIDATAALLGERRFMLADHPTALDAAAYGVIASCTAPIFETELKAMVAGHANLQAYLGRMEERFFVKDDWPSMMETPAHEPA